MSFTLKNPEQESPTNIIVRMPNWLGDLVMATPVLADIKKKWPQAKLTAMCQNPVGQLLLSDPNVDEIFTFNRPSGWIHRDAARHILNPLRHSDYDLGILLTNSFSSAWLFWRGHIKNRLGFSGNLRDPFLNKAVSFPSNRETTHLTKVYKHLLVPLGVPLSDTPPKLYVTDEEKLAAKELLRRLRVPEGASIVGINPGAAFGPAKCWLPERFQEVAKKLLEDPNRVLLFFGDSKTAPLIGRICKNLPERAIDLAGKTNLRELMALTQSCQVFLTNDSGPMHIACALGTKVVALFGSTSDIKTGPYNGGIVIHKRPSCSPCYKRVCPIDFTCMKEITTQEVLEQIEKKLAES